MTGAGEQGRGRNPWGELSKVAVSRAFVAHRARLWAIAQRIVGAELADDVVQEAYVKSALGAGEVRVERPYCYCCRVVRNVALDLRRRRSVELAYRTQTDDGELSQIAGGIPVEEELDGRRMLDAVERVLESVPSRTREAFALHRIGGLSQREIGRQLGCSATLVNFMVRDARTALSRWREHH